MQNLKFEDTYFSGNHTIRVKDKLLDLSTPRVMGILNITPDSFYSGSRVSNVELVLERVKEMLISGATFIDVGGYSSRPGAEDVSEQEEIRRVIPVIEAISHQYPEAIISIDTFRSTVAKHAIEAGASIINDISGFEMDPAIADVAAHYHTPYILMHMRGTPKTMQLNTEYEDLFGEISSYFSSKINILHEKGVKDIILDPGFGFGKNILQNHTLLHRLGDFQFLNKPLLAGISRKSMICKKLDIPPEEALNGTIALNTVALMNGASILRVHDVKETRELVELLK